MASRITTKNLKEKCRRFIVDDPMNQSVDPLIEDAIVTAIREINSLDDVPMAWLRGSYDGLFTRCNAMVSAATKANPGVFTAESLDDDITGHGYTDKDLVFVSGFGDDSLDELNNRLFRLDYVAATTFSLSNLDGENALSTAALDAYVSGGYIYHTGVLLPTATIEPQTGETWELWKIGDVNDVTFDGLPSWSISEDAAKKDVSLMRPGSRPTKWRYWRNDVKSFGSTEHYLCFHPYPSNRYPIRVEYVKSYPDPTFVEDTEYPAGPAEIHDFIWHRALKLLTGQAEKMKRNSKDGTRLMGSIEVLYGQHWSNEVAKDEVKIVNLNRNLLGSRPTNDNFSA